MIKLQAIKRVRRRFRYDPSLVLYLPLYELDGASFMSKDAYGHLCTVTGALWTPYGRIFAGGDDFIELLGVTTQLNFTSGDFSMIAPIKVDDSTLKEYIFSRGAVSATGYRWWLETNGAIYFTTHQAAAQQHTSSDAGKVVTATWQTLGVSRSGASVKLYNNGIDATSTAGNHTNPASSSETVKIGIHNDKIASPFYGTMNFVLVYSKALTQPEHMNIHLVATKWR